MGQFYHVSHTTQMSMEAEHFYFRSYAGAVRKFQEIVKDIRKEFADSDDFVDENTPEDLLRGSAHFDDGNYYHYVKIHEVQL